MRNSWAVAAMSPTKLQLQCKFVSSSALLSARGVSCQVQVRQPHIIRQRNRSATVRPRRVASHRQLHIAASSARAEEPSLVRQTRPSWNYKLGAVYQHLLPGPLLFLPSLLQPVSTIISLEGALHGHEWLHWLLSLLPVPQVQNTSWALLRSFPLLYMPSSRPKHILFAHRWSCNFQY